MSTRHVTIEIVGLSCGGGGALAVERALGQEPGVTRAYVNPLTEMAYVEYDPNICGPDQLVRAIERTGFRSRMPNAR